MRARWTDQCHIASGQESAEEVLKFLDGCGLCGHDVPSKEASPAREIRAWLADRASVLRVLQINAIHLGPVDVKFSVKFSDNMQNREPLSGFILRQHPRR